MIFFTDLNELNEIVLDDEEGEETTETENESVIHRDITENEAETNQDTLNMVIRKFLDDQDDEEGVETTET